MDDCGESGELWIRGMWRDGQAPEVDERVRWSASQSNSFADLPCGERIFLEVDSEECGLRTLHVDLDAVVEDLEVRLHPTEEVLIHVTDDNTDLPIAGAWVGTPTPGAVRTDDHGWATTPKPRLGEPVIGVFASGYSSAMAMPQEAVDGVVDVALVRMTDTEVRCVQGGQPCAAATRVLASAVFDQTFNRSCTLSRTGVWRCPLVPGDSVRAYDDRTQSAPEAAEPGRPVTVTLPVLDGAICLDFDGGNSSPCTLTYAGDRDMHAGHPHSLVAQGVISGLPVQIYYRAGAEVQTYLRCGDEAWTGSAEVREAGSRECQEVTLEPLSWVCADGMGLCRLGAHLFVLMGEEGDYFTGCSDAIPPGEWTLRCEGGTRTLEVLGGETIEVH